LARLKLFQRIKNISKQRGFVYFISIVVGIIFLLVVLHLSFPLKINVSYSTLVTDYKGKVVHAYLSKDDKWRMKTELNEISDQLKKAIIAKEDRYFYYHFGVNPFAIVRALGSNIFKNKRVSGASTITMQVARMLNRKERTYVAKVKEMLRAMQLEWTMSKEEILQLYLNLLPYGGNIEGVKSAAVLYLDKNPQQLSIAEIAALSIIPNKPTSLRPGNNNDLIIKERNKWLNSWLNSGLFTSEEINDALTEPFLASRGEAPKEIPHLAYQLASGNPGKTIHTYINMNKQSKAEKIVKDYISGIRWMNVHNAAVLVVDNTTGKVIAYLGSADFYDKRDGGQVNGAAAIRQPGSALKPLLYALGIDKGLFTPQTVVNDVPVNFKGYQPENYDERFNGPVSISYALENSLNIPAVSTLNNVGVSSFVEKLTDCGFNQIHKDRKKLGLSMVLGGCGVTLQEMTGLYSAIANKGYYSNLKYTSNDTSTFKKQIVSEAAAFMITEMLVKITRPDLPVGYENSSHLPKIAWKTGTSYGRRDAWSIGYNKQYTIGVWVGNFSNEGVPELSGATIATPLLFQLFNDLDYNSQASWYAIPANCEIRKVCSTSGHLPDYFCEQTRMDYFVPLVSPSVMCTHKREVLLSADESFSYCKNCQPQEGYKKKWYDALHPELVAWYNNEGIAHAKIPGHNPNCERLFVENAPIISFPVDQSEYYISLQNPEPLQLICQSPADVKEVFWYINHQFITKVEAGKKVFFDPPEGAVLISCTDDKGRNSSIKIKVKKVDL
jgi:penicillin-binding protein 1C